MTQRQATMALEHLLGGSQCLHDNQCHLQHALPSNSLQGRRQRRRRRRQSLSRWCVRRPVIRSVMTSCTLAVCLLLMSIIPVTLAIKKPVKNLHVTFRGQTYTIPHSVTTVGELTERFEEISGIKLKNDDDDFDNHNNMSKGSGYDAVDNAGLIWKGRLLTLDQTLSEAGIQNGDKVLLVPGQKNGVGLDALAMFVFMMSDAIDKALTKLRQDKPEVLESFKEAWDSLSSDVRNSHGLSKFNRKTVADELRNGFDRAYHRLRSSWEHPAFRRSLHDPERIETYRKIISANLSSDLLNQSSSKLKRAVSSPDVWRTEFIKATSILIKLGDTVLEAILDLLLDVLKGKSSGSYSSQYMSQSSPESHVEIDGLDKSSSSSTTTTAAMDDPSIANDLLYELSESEDDIDFDGE